MSKLLCYHLFPNDVTHVCGHYLTSIGQRGLAGTHHLLFIVDWRAIHDKDLGGTQICDRFI